MPSHSPSGSRPRSFESCCSGPSSISTVATEPSLGSPVDVTSIAKMPPGLVPGWSSVSTRYTRSSVSTIR